MATQKALSINDAARVAALSRSALYLEIANGRLVARKAGRRTVILESELQDYLSRLPTIVPSRRAAA